MKAVLSFLGGLVCVAALAADTDFPKTLAELNAWYIEPPAGSNAATYYLQGFAALRITNADFNSVSLPLIGKGRLPSPDKPLSPVMRTAISAFVSRNKAAFPFFEQGARFDQSRYPIDLRRGEFMLLPHLPRLKSAVQVLKLSAVSHASDGDGRQAGKDVVIGFALGKSLELEPNLISQLVRIACTTIAVDSLEQVLNRTTLPKETLEQLQMAIGKLAEREAIGHGFTRAYVGERLSHLAIFDTPLEQLLKAPNGTEDRQLLEPARSQISALRAKPATEAKAIIAEDRKLFETAFDQAMAVRTNSFPARLNESDIFTRAATDATNKNYIMSSMFLPALPNITPREASGLALLRLAQTAVALECFRSVHEDRYPDSIDELMPKFLVTVPIDPFDGRPLHYRNTVTGYVLYSIGPDLKDDSGKRGKPADGDIVFTVVNPPKLTQ